METDSANRPAFVFEHPRHLDAKSKKQECPWYHGISILTYDVS